MADTTTTNYSLTKPEVGASDATWGTKLNANLDTIDGLLAGSGAAVKPNLVQSLWKIGNVAVTATAAELNKLTGLAGGILSTAGDKTLTGGFDVTDYDAGTVTAGTFTPDPSDSNFQYAINGGAHTLAPPSTSCTLVVQYTNNGSAGTITTSGFTFVTGDALTTTDGDDFILFICVVNSLSVLNVVALQ